MYFKSISHNQVVASLYLGKECTIKSHGDNKIALYGKDESGQVPKLILACRESFQKQAIDNIKVVIDHYSRVVTDDYEKGVVIVNHPTSNCLVAVIGFFNVTPVRYIMTRVVGQFTVTDYEVSTFDKLQ